MKTLLAAILGAALLSVTAHAQSQSSKSNNAKSSSIPRIHEQIVRETHRGTEPFACLRRQPKKRKKSKSRPSSAAAVSRRPRISPRSAMTRPAGLSFACVWQTPPLAVTKRIVKSCWAKRGAREASCLVSCPNRKPPNGGLRFTLRAGCQPGRHFQKSLAMTRTKTFAAAKLASCGSPTVASIIKDMIPPGSMSRSRSSSDLRTESAAFGRSIGHVIGPCHRPDPPGSPRPRRIDR